MKHNILIIILTVARAFGCFKISRWITRREVRILAYHGIALDDEWAFRGGLFMSPATFARRMRFLAKHNYPVLELGDALKMLDLDTHQDCTTVITIDDGWYGTASHMAPIIKQFGFTATLYLCTYYMEKETQVFNVAVDYILWTAETDQIDLHKVHDQLEGSFNVRDESEREAATKTLWEFSKTMGSAEARQKLLLQICDVMGRDPKAFEESRLFSYMNSVEASTLENYGINIQLHTHRHEFPANDFLDAQKEIEDNRRALQNVTSNQLNHFCYPSGAYEQHQLDWLRRMNIDSATTTKSGFNTSKTGKLELKRFLDWEQFSELEFEAELCGFFELLRRMGISI